MAIKHVIKLTDTEAVVKCYRTDAGGGNVDINFANDLTTSTQTYVGNADVSIQEIYWGAKKDKQIDITRIITPANDEIHGHYYLINSGYYDFVGFVDNVYADKDIRISADGPFHVILKLRKTSGWTSNS